MTQDTAKTLPRFRKDLKIYNGPQEIDGSPTFNIYDPTSGKFFKIHWKESLVFKSYTEECSADELAVKISRDFPVMVTTEEINQFFAQAYLLGLLRMPKDGDALYHAHTKSKGSWSAWLIMNYLFVKIPLFHPDAFLSRTLPYVRFLGSNLALLLYAMIIVTGFASLIGRFDQFLHTFSYFFTLEGILVYATTISCVKVIHELSHAYVAKNYGLYVPTMGIGLLVLWPVLFTDVTEGWKLASKKERFLISFAGVAAELVMAGFATYGWMLSSEGIFHSLCFVIASTSWFSTIVINLNPAVRFDGYYILSDLWGVDNLMPRAFAVARWKFHSWLFGLDEPCPESNLSPQRTAGFVIFTMYTILYRFFLYTAIALFVYYEFTKILGIFLFLVEIWIFFLMPVVWEMSTLHKLRSKLTTNLKSVLTSLIFGLLLLWYVLPLPHKLILPAVIVPKNLQVIYAPENGKISRIFAKNGLEVSPKAPLIKIESEELKLESTNADYSQQILNNELLSYLSNPKDESSIAQKKAEIAQNEQVLLGLSKRAANLDIRAEIQGKVTDWNMNLSPGQYVYKGEVFGSIMSLDNMEAIVFASEINIGDFKIGQEADIIVQKSSPLSIQGKIKAIDHKRTNELIYPSLASVYGGPLAALAHREGSRELVLHDSYYVITLSLNYSQENLYFGEIAEIKLRGPWRSLLVETLKYVYRAIYKESSF